MCSFSCSKTLHWQLNSYSKIFLLKYLSFKFPVAFPTCALISGILIWLSVLFLLFSASLSLKFEKCPLTRRQMCNFYYFWLWKEFGLYYWGWGRIESLKRCSESREPLLAILSHLSWQLSERDWMWSCLASVMPYLWCSGDHVMLGVDLGSTAWKMCRCITTFSWVANYFFYFVIFRNYVCFL